MGTLKMDMKMTDHQNCKAWNCRTWNFKIARHDKNW